MSIIGGIFGRSPFGPIHEHALKIKPCLKNLQQMIRCFAAGNREKVLELSSEMHILERQADHIKNEIRANLSSSIFSAVLREDLLLLLKVQDDIPDFCEDIALHVDMRDTPVEEPLREPLLALADQVVACAELIPQLTERFAAIEGKPSQNDSEFVNEKVRKIHEAEHLADEKEEGFYKQLFQREAFQDPITIMFLMKIANFLGAIANKAENAADAFFRLTLR